MPRFEPLTRAAPGGAGARRAVEERHAGDRLIDRRRGGRGAASGRRRLGAAEGPQRRLDRARAALARRVGRADRRHRQGGRARRRRTMPPAPLRDRQGPAPREPDVEQPGIPARDQPHDRRSSAPAAPITSAIPRRQSSSGTETSGAEVFRTDQDGAVMVETDGSRSACGRFGRHLELSATTAHHEDTKDTKHDEDTPRPPELDRFNKRSVDGRFIASCSGMSRLYAAAQVDLEHRFHSRQEACPGYRGLLCHQRTRSVRRWPLAASRSIVSSAPASMLAQVVSLSARR